ncbi:hypothetical protein SESBI_15469 [Sesbania bispinosa]|nr:hypothetical protein SESBI_15469 [Sesbania bispinosa]
MLMQEVVELQQQQRTTVQRARQVNLRLQSAEQIQKQLVSFLAELFENPTFLTRLKHEKEQRDKNSPSPRVRRKFVNQHQRQTGISDSLKEGQIVKYHYQADWRNITISSEIPELNSVSIEQSPDHYFSQGLTRELSEGTEKHVVLSDDELAVMHEVMPTADIMGEGSSSFRLEDPLFKGKNVMSANEEVLAGNFVSCLEDLTKDTGFPEFSPLGVGTESIIKQEDTWNASFNVSGAPSSSVNESYQLRNARIWGHE